MGFTGIVEEMGTVVKLCEVPDLVLWDGTTGAGVVLTVECQVALGDVYEGASIAVNGTCLTVTSWETKPDSASAGTFTVNLAPETLRCTNLGDVKQGSKVNLERAAQMNARNSGHNVQGHVDGTGTIKSMEREGESLWVNIAAAPEVMRYVVPKGYIAVDGTSLTVCKVNQAEGWFNLMLVAHTQTKVVLPHRAVGERVNLEVDVLGKYAEAGLTELRERVALLEAGAHPATPQAAAPAEQSVPAEEAKDNGEIVAINKQLGAGPTKHGAGLKVPLPSVKEAAEIKVAIVHTCWHEELIMLMVDKCADKLIQRGVLPGNISTAVCPGSYELPFLAKRIVDTQDVDVVVCIGLLLKGGTIHMEVIADAVTNQLMSMQMTSGIPIIFGVLTVLAIEQAVERAESELPASWADSALTMALHKASPRMHTRGQ
eukprot:TRINITY_DN1078_c0_g1_i3.p2 TRINITY_DN1078_c0_g1~~TRINITY_DN1078_c0_g1_i3.p2  ORF type:complete len:429 (-),score=134.71 TRINITY_DN1078_c0_g1_i3:120-1406(-)